MEEKLELQQVAELALLQSFSGINTRDLEMKGYQNIIGKTQMLQYDNHYNFIHLVLWRIRYTFSIVKSSQKKNKK